MTEFACSYEGMRDASLTILLVDDRAMRAYHKMYFGKSCSTDVISFPFLEMVRETGYYLGDIVVSAQRAKAVSKRIKRTTQSELILYVLHGLLHLLGYQDGTSEKRAVMFRKQNQLLEKWRDVRS